MKFYYELVDDLLGREEFAKLVEDKINDTGGILEDHVAAMLVLKDLGRAHRKIAALDGGASLVLFFGKVTGKSGPRAYKKEGGEDGYVSDITVGDETGTARLLLWGEKARGVEEFDQGDVIEVLARFKSGEGGIPQLSVIAIKESSSEISCTVQAPAAGNNTLQNVTAHIVAVRRKSFFRKDGTAGEYYDVIAGNETGVFRIVSWAPEMFEEIRAGDNVIAGNLQLKSNRGKEEYHANEGSTVEITDREVEIAYDGISGVSPGGYYSVRGRVKTVAAPRNFTRKNGEESWVRMIRVADESGELPIVMWDELAVIHIVRDDLVAVYNAGAKEGRFGGIELNTTSGSAVEILNSELPSGFIMKGTVVRSPFGYTIDNGLKCYVLNRPLREGMEVSVEGQISRRIISPEKCTANNISKKHVQKRIDDFLDRIAD